MTLNLERTTADWLVCECGNEPDIDGFYSCLPTGEIIAPDATGVWDSFSYLCYRCGCIYDITTLDQIGEATTEVMRANYLRGDTDIE